MAKTKIKSTTNKAGKLAGKTVAFVGKFGYKNSNFDSLKSIAELEGGKVVDIGTTIPDYLISNSGSKPPTSLTKIQKNHPEVQVLDEASFIQLTAPSTEDFLAILRSGPHSFKFWCGLQQRIPNAIDLKGTDFRSYEFVGVLFTLSNVDHCDFRGTTLNDVSFDKVTGSRFDGAKFSGGSFTNATDCSLKNIEMNDTRWNPAEFVRCDFTGATLRFKTGRYTRTTDCIFKNAELRRSDLENSQFRSADFSGANLIGALLKECDFTDAKLDNANLSGADLRNAKLVNSDLTNAGLQDAILCGADLTGATIDGADFTGANLSGVITGNIDTSKAKNFQRVAARTPGPNMLELAKAANSAKRFTTSIELELGPDEYVILQPSLWRYGSQSWASGGYSHQKPNWSSGNSVNAPTFEQGMLNLAVRWSRGKPRFDTIKVEAKQCPIKAKELRNLAVAAWYEALGLDVPSPEELQKQQEAQASAVSDLREIMIGELKGGPAGIKKWNERPDREKAKLGKVRKHDFSNAKMAGAMLVKQDFEGSQFTGANLKKASFEGSQLNYASFTNAQMNEVHLAGSKCSATSFEHASLTKCNLRAANFRRSNFQNADLTGSNFSYSDLGGANFSGAKLDGVEFLRTKFDEKTTFPPGFTYPEGLEWKGAGPRPGSAPPPLPPKTGTIDFETFLQQLNNKVEEARMQKAGSMLKAERFQLFAEVKDDSLVGVVKSQTSKDLVYSCRLASDGTFSCCTQNLKPCGGLRGALCKHLLVLIVGLAKAEQFDAATVDHWINLSRSQKPAIDEDVMSATFLRYKGAEAGEIDWRPTETIPEDFYAM